MVGLYWGILAVSIVGGATPAPATAQEDSDCLKCHASAGLKLQRGDREISLFVDALF
jgi:hypothetical protein